ncbi:MAG: glycerophosphodiester phosphodiesterase [Myxococcales bacterium]|nr:glycerophosphodiester phosphodiesterase [Myxococcales bacterium]
MPHPFFAELAAPLHIAHRGGAGLYPENTLFAFQQAVARHHTQMIELDVHATADGEIVVFHDDTLERTTDGAGPLAARTWAELQVLDAGYRWSADGQRFPFRGQDIGIPRLVEVLRALPDLPLNLEIKPDRPELAAPVVALLKAAGALGRCCLGSFHDRVGEALHAAAPDACHYFAQGPLTAFVMAALMGQPLPTDDRWHVLDMPATHNGLPLITPALIAAARQRDLWVNVWTIDDAATMRALLAAGVGGIMTDRPDTLRAVLDGRE